jgi:hypothetical protein
MKKGIGSESGSVIHWLGSAVSEPYRNATDPEFQLNIGICLKYFEYALSTFIKHF